jgi:hypothetical protein
LLTRKFDQLRAAIAVSKGGYGVGRAEVEPQRAGFTFACHYEVLVGYLMPLMAVTSQRS